MAIAVQMPKLGNTVEESLLAAWRKQRGDQVAAGEVIAEIETDKTNFELTAPADGTLLDLFFEVGALVPVFTNVCVIGNPGENIDQFRPAAGPAGAPVQDEPAAVQGQDAVPDTWRPQPVQVAQRHGAVPAAALSPRARRFVREHGLDVRDVRGSGPDGRILEEDVRRYYHTRPRLTAPAQRLAAQGYVAPDGGSGLGGMVRSIDLGPAATKLSTMRERIARRMRESLASTAQYTLQTSANARGLLALRRKVKASGQRPDINVNDLVVFCVIKALVKVPDLNVEFRDGSLYRHTDIHIGFACDTDRGLLVPVVHDSERLTVAELAVAMKTLAAQAVQGTIAVDDLSGGTFTVSNLGALGIESFTPLLNPPQVAILGMNAIQVKPVRNADGNIEFIDAIGLSLTVDHQVIDGAPAARFLKLLKEIIENVESQCTI